MLLHVVCYCTYIRLTAACCRWSVRGLSGWTVETSLWVISDEKWHVAGMSGAWRQRAALGNRNRVKCVDGRDIPTSQHVTKHIPTSQHVTKHIPTSQHVTKHIPTSQHVTKHSYVTTRHKAYFYVTTRHKAYSYVTTRHKAYSYVTTRHKAYFYVTTRHKAYSYVTTRHKACPRPNSSPPCYCRPTKSRHTIELTVNKYGPGKVFVVCIEMRQFVTVPCLDRDR
jgi:hypothetical protein